MPRIPLSEKGLVQNRQDAVYMQGAPGLDWKMGEGRALINFGDSLGRGLYGLGKAIKEWGEKERDTNDKLMAQQDLNLFNSTFAQLRQDLANNPGIDDTQKAVMIHEWQERYADERKQYTEKMSGDFRKLHDARMLGRSADARNDINLLMIQGRVQRDMDLANAQFQAALQAGDVETARRIVSDHRGGLYSEEQAQKMLVTIDQQAPYYLAKRDIEAGDLKAEERIKNDEFGKMPIALKERALAAARTQRINRENQTYTEYLGGILDGSIYPDDDAVINRFERGEISETAKNKMLKLNRQERDRLRIEADRAESRQRQAKERQRRALEQQKTDKLAAFKLDLALNVFSSNPNEAALQMDEWMKRSEIAFPDDPKSQLELRKSITEAVHDGLSGKGDFALPGGAEVLSFIQENYGATAQNAKGLKYDPNGFFNTENSPEFMKARWYEVVDRAKNMLRQGKPAAEIIKDIKDQVSLLNDGQIGQIMRYDPIPDGEQERFFNGSIAIFGADKKFIRWKDGK